VKVGHEALAGYIRSAELEALTGEQDQGRSAAADPLETVLQPAIDMIFAEQQKCATLQQQLDTQEQHISELEQKCAELSRVNGDMSSRLAAALADLSRLKAAACGVCNTLGGQALAADNINPTTADYERCLQQAAAAAMGKTDSLSSDMKLLQAAVRSAYSTLMGQALQGDSFTAAVLEQHLQQAAEAAAQKFTKMDATQSRECSLTAAESQALPLHVLERQCALGFSCRWQVSQHVY
jgi:bacterioferritin (cytochrome b1)